MESSVAPVGNDDELSPQMIPVMGFAQRLERRDAPKRAA